MKLVLIILGSILGVAGLIYQIYFLLKFCKDRAIKKIDKRNFIYLLIVPIIFTVALPLFLGGCSILNNWQISSRDLTALIIGGAFFGLSSSTFVTSFILRYYKTSLESVEQKHIISIVMFSSIPIVFLSLILLMEGLAPYLAYPLTNGITFGGEHGIDFTTYKNPVSGFHIAFYGVIIVAGAVIVYFICDHKFYQRYHKHGLLDTCFLIAFPMGIVGARLWYCLVLRPDYYLANPLDIFRIWDGGLAIMGGAILGIISGVTYMMLAKKYINIRKAMDIVVPAILIAQAIGRWGNFFNHEVYGGIVSASDWWFIPTFIRNQMSVSFLNGMPSGNQMFVPLFLIESITNIAGYFIIVYAIGKPLQKYLAWGDLAGCYLIWYGITRIIMEPLRYQEAGQQTDFFSQSFYAAIALVAGGAILIVAFQIYEFAMKKTGHKIKGL